MKICLNILGSGRAIPAGFAPPFRTLTNRSDRSIRISDRFHLRILVETFAAAKEIVLAGRGLGAAIKGQIEQELREKRLVTLPFDAPWLSLNYGFITKRGRTLAPAALAFMETVRTIERDIAA